MSARKIFIGGGIVAGLAYVISLVKGIKQGVGNIDFNITFDRVHGLVGPILNATVRVYFNLSLKNFSGFDLEAKNIYTRIEVQKAGTAEWSTIATQADYMNVAVINGKTYNLPIGIDFKGLPVLNAFNNKGNKHRAVVTYVFKGIKGEFVKELDLQSAVSAYVATIKSKLGLSGATVNLIA